MFDIYHDCSELQFKNDEFLKNSGSLLKEILYSRGIYNVLFGYSYSYAVEKAKQPMLHEKEYQ